jgi:hypothetical protein
MPTRQGGQGGYFGTPVYPSAPPKVDVASIIGSLSQAFRSTREGILARQAMEQRAQQQRDANSLAMLQFASQHELATRQMELEERRLQAEADRFHQQQAFATSEREQTEAFQTKQAETRTQDEAVAAAKKEAYETGQKKLDRDLQIELERMRAKSALDVKAKELQNKPATKDQLQADAYAKRMIGLEGSLVDLEKKGGTSSTVSRLAGNLPKWLGGGEAGAAQNVFDKKVQQQYRQAAQDWILAKLRRESGAEINGEELTRYMSTYFAQPGDSEALKDQKRISRANAADELVEEAGPAWRPPLDYSPAATRVKPYIAAETTVPAAPQAPSVMPTSPSELPTSQSPGGTPSWLGGGAGQLTPPATGPLASAVPPGTPPVSAGPSAVPPPAPTSVPGGIAAPVPGSVRPPPTTGPTSVPLSAVPVPPISPITGRPYSPGASIYQSTKTDPVTGKPIP